MDKNHCFSAVKLFRFRHVRSVQIWGKWLSWNCPALTDFFKRSQDAYGNEIFYS